MCCDSGASGQQPTSIPKAVFGNERDLDSPTQNAQRSLSSASSLDPIAISEDEEELVKLMLIPSSPHLKPLSEVQSRTSTPKSLANATEGLDDCKPNPSYSVAVPSPPRRSTHGLTHIERGIPEQDASLQSRDPARARGSSSKHVEKLEGDIMNGEVSDPVPPRPTRPTDSETTLLDHTRDGSLCGMEPLEDVTERDIDILLDAVPVPFNFSLSRHHLTSLKNGENDGQRNSLWWYHPIFEARAKADIRRTLSALLPEDPAQDPPFPIGSAGGWKSEMRPRQSGARIWAERLEDAFGPGPFNRGLGRKPCRVAVSPSLSTGFTLYTYATPTNPLITLTITSLFFNDRRQPRSEMLPIVRTPRTVLVKKWSLRTRTGPPLPVASIRHRGTGCPRPKMWRMRPCVLLTRMTWWMRPWPCIFPTLMA